MLKKIKFRSLNIDITSVIIDDAWGFKLNSEKYHFNFRGCQGDCGEGEQGPQRLARGPGQAYGQEAKNLLS